VCAQVFHSEVACGSAFASAESAQPNDLGKATETRDSSKYDLCHLYESSIRQLAAEQRIVIDEIGRQTARVVQC